jgi:UPF0716 protein FxsA
VFVRLVLLLTVVPFVELMILLRLAEWLGWQGTIGLVVLTGVLGAWLARREGLKTLARIHADLEAGVPPTGAVVDGVLIFIAGVVLVTPGVLTDLCGFALLVPPLRAWARRRLSRAFKRRVVVLRPDGEVERDSFIDVDATSTNADSKVAREPGDSVERGPPAD